jgi:hypothetical protein
MIGRSRTAEAGNVSLDVVGSGSHGRLLDCHDDPLRAFSAPLRMTPLIAPCAGPTDDDSPVSLTDRSVRGPASISSDASCAAARMASASVVATRSIDSRVCGPSSNSIVKSPMSLPALVDAFAGLYFAAPGARFAGARLDQLLEAF